MLWFLFVLVLVAVATPPIVERQRRPISRAMQADAPGRFSKLTRGVTHYQWVGPENGRQIVCIHGLTTPSYVWTALVKGFVRMGFRVLTYDLYGRGLSARPEGLQDPEFFRQQLAELLEDQEVDEGVILVGYSMGGAIAVDYTQTHPQMVERLILLATAGLGATVSPFVKFMINVPVIGDGLMYTFGGNLFGKSSRAMNAALAASPNMNPWPMEERQSQGFLPAVLSSYRHTLSVDQLGAHRAMAKNGTPVLAIWGDKDSAIPLSAMGRLAEVNRAAYQDVLKGADHGLLLTHSDEIIPIVQEFLREAV
ncbi:MULTISPECIES: alpha/beta fold hydrolase [Falsihalocynthiibacter]|uniref:alpha/beta fold hydrolase n=1 Tax=Falsihalocynthiibacter TaxID=2854182 RepID=UPI0030021502